MKKLIPLIAALLLTACASAPPAVQGEPLSGYSQAVITVKGMSCPLCSNNIDGRLRKVAGIEDVRIDLKTGLVTATFSKTTAPTRGEIERAIKEAGFTLGGMELQP